VAAGDVPIAIGFQVWGESTTWPELMETARTIERFGFDSLWANDHFLPAAAADPARGGEREGAAFEGWVTLAGFAAATSRIPIGMLVSGAGYRNAGLTVKMATALDHMSGGRMTLGLGAGWHRRDHAAFGFDLPPVGRRLDRLEEQVTVARRLLDGEAVTFDGAFVRMAGATNLPPPLRRRLPLLIGGSGPRRTLPLVARAADVWNGEGDPARFAELNRRLDELALAAGRDAASIRRTVGLPPVSIGTSRERAVERLRRTLERNGVPAVDAATMAAASPLAGTATAVLEALARWAAAGAEEAIVDWPPAGDLETLERLAEARARAGRTAAGSR
jgi:alkanesulfonate monooxygenase SsuD/methylene tetrahydromethanopterin reductase-like flavin-dependent oxidoreductase (luciferase family)